MLMVTYIASSGGLKETLVVTPLMDFVRQKRAAKIGSQVHGNLFSTMPFTFAIKQTKKKLAF